jgi:hypothetical protein
MVSDLAFEGHAHKIEVSPKRGAVRKLRSVDIINRGYFLRDTVTPRDLVRSENGPTPIGVPLIRRTIYLNDRIKLNG